MNNDHIIWFSPSVRPFVTPLSLWPHHRIIMKFPGVITIDRSEVHAKGQGQRSEVNVREVKTYGGEIMHKVLCCLEGVPYCFSMSSVKCKGHTGQNIDDLDPNWVLSDCNSSLTSPIALKWCHIVFRRHPSNFKVTRAEQSTIWIKLE